VQWTAQGEGDLGARMARAAQRAVAAGQAVLLIGTDCPALDAAALQRAAQVLHATDAVMVPAHDGGYVLLGLRRFDARVFKDIDWSTARVAAQTRQRIQALGWELTLCPAAYDIDEPADLQRLPAGWLQPLPPPIPVCGGLDSRTNRSEQMKQRAVVIGSGGIGAALADALSADPAFDEVLVLGRRSSPALDLLDENSIERAVQHATTGGQLRLVIDATGVLHGEGMMPEKSLRQLDPAQLAQAFAINAIGPALLMKHVLPALPREGRAVFATLSAKVGSIGDNRLGGWYAYRASKAALNQFVRTAAIELRRIRPQSICVALHPGTVDTGLSAPFARSGLQVQTPAVAAARLLGVLAGLQAEDSGEFFDYRGERLPW
jgi:NAD(P)-dependent dehydrogenase (short-subunit alcohol dehydrogenase family)